jgi:hypothetical protein
MPIFVAVLSAFAGYLYVWANVQVIVPAVILYAVAGLWYVIWGRSRVLSTAPEEVAARIAEKLRERERAESRDGSRGWTGESPVPPKLSAVERVTAPLLVAGILSLGWMVLRATNLIPGLPFHVEIIVVTAVWVLLFVLVSAVGLYSTRRQ